MAAEGLFPVLSCEHGSGSVPARWQALFEGKERVLRSHRGFDRGSADLARLVARRRGAPLFLGGVSRLVVDLNRSPGSRSLFSTVTGALPPTEREQILEGWYRPYRRRVTEAVEGVIRGGGAVLHLSVHTFAPVVRGVRRRADAGILYDPARPAERAFARLWRDELRRRLPTMRFRLNYPYRGVSDGFTTCLRKALPALSYLGLELEVNGRLAPSFRGNVGDAVAASLGAALALFGRPRPPLARIP